MSGGVDALAEKDLVQKEWRDAKSLVEAEAVEAEAQEKTEREPGGGGGGSRDNAGSLAATWASASFVASAGAQQILIDNLAKAQVLSLIHI